MCVCGGVPVLLNWGLVFLSSYSKLRDGAGAQPQRPPWLSYLVETFRFQTPDHASPKHPSPQLGPREP